MLSNTSQTFDEPAEFSVPYIESLTAEQNGIVHDLVDVLMANRSQNMERSRYYHGDVNLKDLGYAIDPKLRKRAGATVNWAAKAVDMLAQRSTLDGFAWTDGQDRLTGVLDPDELDIVYGQANVSQLIHCFSTLTVTGKPGAVSVHAYSAINSSVLVDRRMGGIRAGLAVIDVDDRGLPDALNIYLPYATLELDRTRGGWVAEKKANGMGRPLMEVMPYAPSLDRPLGRPRINKAVRQLMDKAKVTNALLSIYSELFTIPQRYLFGTDPDNPVFANGSWDALMGHVLEITDDGTGEKPSYGQLAQVSPQPLIEVYQLWAKEFSSETSIPLNCLGVVQDNPASAEAMYAAQEPLVVEADRMNRVNGIHLANVARMAIALDSNRSLSQLEPDERAVTVNWGDTAHISDASRADASLKEWSVLQSGEVPDVVLEHMGWDESDRIRYRSQTSRAASVSAIDAIAGAVRGARDMVAEGEGGE